MTEQKHFAAEYFATSGIVHSFGVYYVAQSFYLHLNGVQVDDYRSLGDAIADIGNICDYIRDSEITNGRPIGTASALPPDILVRRSEKMVAAVASLNSKGDVA